MNKNIFESHSVSRTFFKFAFPSVLGLLVVSFQAIIDGIFVGNFVGPSGLAAINISMPYINLVNSIVLMIVLGGGISTSIYLGRKEKQKANEIASFTIFSMIAILGVISVLSYIFSNRIIYFLGANDNLFHSVKSYFIPMLTFSIFYNGIIFTETFARIGGKPNSVFLSCFVACVSNVVLDYFFIVKFQLGVSGAAYATVLANGLGTLALIRYFFGGRSDIQIIKPKGSFNLLKKMLYNGSSEMLTVVSTAVVNFLFNKIIMENIGVVGISAMTIIFYVNKIVNITLFGLSQGLQPVVSYNLGAKRVDRIYKVLKVAMITGGSIGILSFGIMKLYSVPLINLFTRGEQELTNLALEAIGYFIFAYIISFVNIISSSFHTAIEKPLESAVIALLRSLVFVLIFLTILPKIFGNRGIWMAVPLAEASCLIISLLITKSSLRKLSSLSYI